MNNVFPEIKMPEAARFYGLEMSRAGITCLTFTKNESIITFGKGGANDGTNEGAV